MVSNPIPPPSLWSLGGVSTEGGEIGVSNIGWGDGEEEIGVSRINVFTTGVGVGAGAGVEEDCNPERMLVFLSSDPSAFSLNILNIFFMEFLGA
jgi:hypothetical protein